VEGGLGIMLDDVGAAIYAALSLQAILYIYGNIL
jgi:phosphatidylglycerophosphatase A